jgi:hypothetical protein
MAKSWQNRKVSHPPCCTTAATTDAGAIQRISFVSKSASVLLCNHKKISLNNQRVVIVLLRVIAAALAATVSLALPSELLAGGEWLR